MVYAMNGLAWLEAGFLIARSLGKAQLALGWNSLFLMASLVFFNLLNWIPWYPAQKEKLGIRIHFQKNVVPVSYLLALAFALRLLGVGDLALIPFSILLLPMYYVSLILLSFHFKDSSSQRAGYFSHNLYLKEEESA